VVPEAWADSEAAWTSAEAWAASVVPEAWADSEAVASADLDSDLNF